MPQSKRYTRPPGLQTPELQTPGLDGRRLKVALLSAARQHMRTRPVPEVARPVVFISYAHEDRLVAARLAHYLQARGIAVWWDRHLAGGDSFRAKILEMITAAKAVVVIWSHDAVASNFVLDEAGRALRDRKLVPTMIKGFRAEDLPHGFGQLHTQGVGQRTELRRALAGLGVLGAFGARQ